MTLDIATAEGFEIFEKLIAGADILIHNVIPPEMDRVGLSYDRLKTINPKLIMTSITPWGLEGPYRNMRAEDLTLWAAGGLCVLNGGGPEYPDLPPLKCHGSQSGFQGGVHSAVATMGALFARLRDGEGQHIDAPIQESIAAQLEMTFEYWPYMKMIATRLGQKPLQPVETFKCKDGYIYICCIEEHQWQNFVHLMGDPEWAGEEIFKDRLIRAVNWDALKIFLEEYVSQQTVLDLYTKAQERRDSVRTGFHHGRSAQQRASKGPRIFCRDRPAYRRNPQISRRPAQVRKNSVGDPTAGADAGTAQSGNLLRTPRHDRGASC